MARKYKRPQVFVTLLTVVLALGSFKAHSNQLLEYVWSNTQGLVSASSCEVSKKPDTRFQVVQNSSSDDPGYENLRQRNKDIFARVVNKSLVKFLNGSDVGNFKNIEVTAVHEEPGLDVPGHVAQRNYNGYIYKESLRSIKHYIFQITGSPEASEAGRVEKLPETEFSLVGSFLQPALQGDEHLIYKCDDNDYIVFDVHVAGHAGAVVRVGVNWDQTKIFRHLRTFTIAEAEEAIAREEQAQQQAQEEERSQQERQQQQAQQEGSEQQVREQGSQQQSQPHRSLQWWYQYIAGTHSVAEDAAVAEREEQGEGYDEDELRQAQEAERRAQLQEQAEAEEARRLQAERQASQNSSSTHDEETPVILGELEFRVCVDQGPVAVRGLTEDGEINTEDELFRVRRYALAKPVQGWGEDEKKATVRGVEYAYIQVQFPEVEGENIGWVANSLIAASSSCAGYQKSLGDQQTLVCTESGQLNVYDKNLELMDFRADQFEEIAVRTDVDVEPKFKTVDGKRYEYTPVTFPNRSGVTGWVAESFIRTKASCEPYQNRGSSGGAGPRFPTIKRPTMSYVKGGPGVGKKYFGAPRDNGRKHAACDLFRPAYERVDSVSDGTLLRGPYEFFSGTFAIEVKSTTGKVLRYGETSSKRPNRTIKKGDFISTIGKNYSGTAMLHFEMYRGSVSGSLSNRSKPYNRRSDLMDPTSGLREWEKARFGRSY